RNAAIAAVKVFSLTPFGSATYELATAPPLLQVHDERGEALGRGRPLAGTCRMHEGALDGRSRLRGASERGERDRPAHALDPVAGALRALVARAGRHGGRRRGLAEERLGDREADARRAECGRERGPCAPRTRRGDPDVAQGNRAVRRARVAAAREQARARAPDQLLEQRGAAVVENRDPARAVRALQPPAERVVGRDRPADPVGAAELAAAGARE